jgi:hypothetical protein
MSEENNYNEQEMADFLAKKEAEGKAQQTVDAVDTEATEMEAAVNQAGLGRVNMDNFGPAKAEKSDILLGWMELSMSTLPSKGRFYPTDTSIKIRSAKVAEIRHFSTMDENNILDIDEKLNAIVESCTSVSSKTTRMSFKDLLEEDRFALILSIRDLTFPEPEATLKVPFQDKKGTKHEIEIRREYFQYFSIPAEIDKYFDPAMKAFVIQTKNHGEIIMRPPTIGLMQEVTKYIRERREQGLNIDQSLIQVAPYIAADWRSFNQKRLFELEIEMNGWDPKKYMLIYRVAEQMKVGLQPEMKVMVGDVEEIIPINFRDGIKSLFIVQDLSGELL